MKIPQDKITHFLAGVTTAAFVYPFGPLEALVASSATAVSKEVLDYYGYGMPDVLDAVATVLGGTALVVWYEVMAGRLPEHLARIQAFL